MRYTLIGASLRGELLDPHPSVLRQRVAAALSGTAPSAPKVREQRWAERLARPLLGVGIAATVAVVADRHAALVERTGARARQARRRSRQSPLQVSDAAAAPSYVVPQDTDQSRTGATDPAHELPHAPR